MLGRMALRMMTLMALTNARMAPYPTMAGENVHDSAIRVIDQSDPTKEVAVVSVYTDDSEEENQQQGSVYEAGKTSCILNIECAFIVKREQNDAQGFAYPETEPELEAKLDMLERQVLTVLFSLNTIWAKGWRNLVVQTNSVSSGRVHSDDSGLKLALRTISINVDVRPDCLPDAFPDPVPPVDLTEIFAAVTATTEQQNALTDRMAATQQIPMPLKLVVQEIEKANWVREVNSQPQIQEAEVLRAQVLANAPDGPFKHIQDLQADDVTEAWQAYIRTDTYQTGAVFKKTHAGPEGFPISPNFLPVDDITEAVATTYGSYVITNGAWAYTLDTANPTVAALAEDGQLKDQFEILRGNGAKLAITITIIGT